MYKKSDTDPRQSNNSSLGIPIIGYSKEELERIKVALSKKLGPEFISKRKGPGYNSVQYLEGWKAINLANEIFGPNGWCTELRDFKVDYIDEKNGAISLGLSAIVRVILKDGTFHEDIGYGSIDNCKSKSAAFDKCKKEAMTDGMKRALRQFGNALGNCLYDKDFLQQITKVTSEPLEFDESNLMRRSTNSIVKVEEEKQLPPINEPKEMETDESPQSNYIASTKNRPCSIERIHKEQEEQNSTFIEPAKRKKSTDDFEDSFVFSDDWPEEIENEDKQQQQQPNNEQRSPDSDPEINGDELSPEEITNIMQDAYKSQTRYTPTDATSVCSPDVPPNIPAQVSFVPAKIAEKICQDPTLQNSQKFDASFQSTQIRKSTFINHNRSLPIKKVLVDDKESKINKLSFNKVKTPVVKRSIGVPPSMLTNKRLHK